MWALPRGELPGLRPPRATAKGTPKPSAAVEMGVPGRALCLKGWGCTIHTTG